MKESLKTNKMGRRCLLSASPIRLRRLRGFSEAIGELVGVKGRIAGHVVLRDACWRVAEANPCPDGIIRLEAVIEKRRTVGHRAADVDSVIRIAHAVVQGRTMEVRLEGPLVPKLARACGLRDARRRPWAKDPQLAEQLAGLADRFLNVWTPMVLKGRPEDGWFCALMTPRIIQKGVAAGVIVVMNKDGRGTRFLPLSLSQCPMDETRTEEGVRGAINFLLKHPPHGHSDHGGIWQSWDTDDLFAAASQMGLRCLEFNENFNFRKRLEIYWVKVRATALARFRRLLPREIQEHASLCLRQFADARTAAVFLSMRRDWTIEDYIRVNQAIRAAPILRNAIRDVDTVAAITAGKPLGEVIRSAVEACSRKSNSQLPHPKTVKSLRGTWNQTFQATARGGRISLLVSVLDALYRNNPHQVALNSGEMIRVAEIASVFPAEPDLIAVAILAHRDAKGRIRHCKDLHDVYNWVFAQCHLILRGKSGPQVRDHFDMDAIAPVIRATFGIVFPPARTLAGLDALVREWHENQRRLDAVLDDLFKSMLLTKMDHEGVDAGVISFPHFMVGEQIIDGVTMRPLRGPEQIAIEGEEMGHCVGTYVGAASAGRSLLISQKSESGRSTVEVAMERDDRGEPVLVVRQNRSFENGDPPLLHRNAMTKLLKSIPEDLRRDLVERIRIASALEDQRSGQTYAMLNADELLRMKRQSFDNMRRFMPRAMRKQSMEEWLADMRRLDGECDQRRMMPDQGMAAVA